ncbi:MAG TPA: hypothetical protein VK766_11695 [Cytophagaceae bacterium]|nr:hypothetical protein [Cytophagaceae bacterium]
MQGQGLYLGGSVCYGLKASSTIVSTNYNPDGSKDVIKGSFGMGLVPNISIGYLFNKNIGIELGLGYLIGSKKTLSSTTKYNVNSFYINPSFVIRAGEGKIVPYGKMGIFLGLINSGYLWSDGINYGVNDNGGISTGITSTLGVDFMMSDKFVVFGELSGRFANWSPSHFSYPGVNGTYVTHVSLSDPYNYSPSIVLPISAIGLNVGVKYYLFKK